MWIHFCLLTAAAFLGAGKRRELAPFGSPRTRPKRSDVAVGPRAVAAKACARARRARARYKEREREDLYWDPGRARLADAERLDLFLGEVRQRQDELVDRRQEHEALRTFAHENRKRDPLRSLAFRPRPRWKRARALSLSLSRARARCLSSCAEYV